MYTLEAHLEQFHEEEFKILNAIWKLNKKNLPQAQNAISFNFPHYSLHEKTHSDTIVRNIESYLGPERIEHLSPTDTWLILMAAHTHDLGMIIFSKTIEDLWPGDSFIEYLNGIAASSVDNELVTAANLLIQLTAKEKDNSTGLINLVLGIRRALILIVSNHFRSIHHASSRKMIMREDEQFSRMVSGLIMENLPNRFTNVLADIAYSHGIEFYDVLNILENEADGIGNDKMHPRFVACLLRLGDLLDVDDKRFSSFNEMVLDQKLPSVSQTHKEKHASIRHLLISPKGIEITADCKSEEVYRTARQWFDWLEKEVEHQTKEWALIAPNKFPGLPPMISKGKIKVLFQSGVVADELMNLRFQISSKRMFDIIEGHALYEDIGVVFIRELVQNALDASKVQMWKMITEGIYDEAIRGNPGYPMDPNKDVTSQVQFPFHIPNQIYLAFVVEMNISWDSSERNELIVEVCDRGTGISKMDLLRMTSKVGENKNAISGERQFVNSMPKFLQPTGAFGIGLQSIFHVANSFLVKTKSEGEKEKEIIFRSAKRGEYCTMSEGEGTIKRGSKIYVRIKRELLDILLPSRLSMSIIDSEDTFDENYSHLFISYLRYYLLDEFADTKLLKINFFGQEIKSSFYSNIQGDGIFKEESITPVHDGEVSCFIKRNYEYHEVTVFENILGSEIKFYFLPVLISFDKRIPGRRNNAYELERSGYLVRDIPVEMSFPEFYKTSYAKVLWNLQNSSSDKILNISRDKFIKRKREEIERQFLDKILPKALATTRACFIKNYGEKEMVDDSTANEFFNIELMCKMSGVEDVAYPRFLHDKQIPSETAVHADGSKVSFVEFFAEDKFLNLHIIKAPGTGERLNVYELWEKIRGAEEQYQSGILLIDFSYFSSYLHIQDFLINYYKVLDVEGYRIVVTAYDRRSQNTVLRISEEEKKEIFKNPPPYSGLRRNYFLPYEPYAPVIAIKPPEFWTFEHRPKFSDRFIVSPFRNMGDFTKMARLITGKELDEPALINLIVNDRLFDELVTPNLIKYIQKNKAFKNGSSVQEIKQMYAVFIKDYVTHGYSVLKQ